MKINFTRVQHKGMSHEKIGIQCSLIVFGGGGILSQG